MKLYPNLLNAAVLGLKKILLEKRQADTVVEELLSSNRKWGSRDRNFIAENIYKVIRYKRLYEFCADTNAEDETYTEKIIGAKLILEDFELPATFAVALDKTTIIARHEEGKAIRKIRESIPDWLDELGAKELGEDWETELAALNKQAKLCLRVNTIKTSKQQVMDMFLQEGIELSITNTAADALVVYKKKSMKSHSAYKDGLFEIQDVSSQQVAPMLDAQPGMKVIDACAGAGGKTLHIAALMHNQGHITALDITGPKLTELQTRAKRAGATIITTLKVNENQINELKDTADRLLLDVPCSGLGVMRRKPDAKWQLTPEFLDEIRRQQADILDSDSAMLKRGGIMVYSTCSILPSENEEQVRDFIERQEGKFRLLEQKKISAASSGFDGFFMAKMVKL